MRAADESAGVTEERYDHRPPGRVRQPHAFRVQRREVEPGCEVTDGWWSRVGHEMGVSFDEDAWTPEDLVLTWAEFEARAGRR